jgi:nucleotide-binding universal stress UspA family protein
MVEIDKILFPIDLTGNSSRVLPYVLSAAEKYNSLIYLLHVIEKAPSWVAYGVAAVYDEKEALDEAEGEMEAVCKEHLQNCPNFQKKIVLGNPTMEILKTIKAEGIDLVIMGTHGRKGVSHLFFGGVVESIVKSSPVPVLIVNSKEGN